MQADWVATPPFGTCLTCGTSANDRGFVNGHAEVTLKREEYVISGYADLILCADCIHQMGRLVGMATPAETEAFALREYELSEQNEKLKDEVAAERQRFHNLVGLTPEELGIIEED